MCNNEWVQLRYFWTFHETFQDTPWVTPIAIIQGGVRNYFVSCLLSFYHDCCITILVSYYHRTTGEALVNYKFNRNDRKWYNDVHVYFYDKNSVFVCIMFYYDLFIIIECKQGLLVLVVCIYTSTVIYTFVVVSYSREKHLWVINLPSLVRDLNQSTLGTQNSS